MPIGTIVETLDPEQLRKIFNSCQEVELAEQATEVSALTFKALEQIVVAAQKIANPISRSRTLTAVANLYAYVEKDAQAAKLLNKALSDLQAGAENLRSDARSEASRALEEIIAGYLRIGQVDQALEVAQLIQTGASRRNCSLYFASKSFGLIRPLELYYLRSLCSKFFCDMSFAAQKETIGISVHGKR